MDHPKCYVGEIKYAKKDLINNLKLVYKKNINTYTGISLFDNKKRLLNTYIRFEEKNLAFRCRTGVDNRYGMVLPKYTTYIYIYIKCYV